MIRPVVHNVVRSVLGASSSSWKSYCKKESLLWIKENTRDGMILPDVNGNDVSILTSATYLPGTKTITTPVSLNISNGFHVSGWYLYKANLATNITRVILSYRTSGSDSAEGVWQFYLSSVNKFEFIHRGQTAYRTITVNLVPVDLTWYNFDITCIDGIITVRVNSTSNIGTLYTPTSYPTVNHVHIASLGGGTSPAAGYFTDIFLSTGVTYYRYPLQEHNRYYFYDTGPNAAHASGNIGNYGVLINSKCSHVLDHGYSVYTKALNADVYVPFSDSGEEIIPIEGVSILAGYAKSYSKSGDLLNHNMAPSLLRLPSDTIFDRSTVKYLDAARGSDYDATNITDFDVSKISDLKILAEWLDDGYRGRIFPICDYTESNGLYAITKLKGLIATKTDKTGSEEGRIFTNTGNKVIALLDGSGSYLYDNNNYVIINS